MSRYTVILLSLLLVSGCISSEEDATSHTEYSAGFVAGAYDVMGATAHSASGFTLPPIEDLSGDDRFSAGLLLFVNTSDEDVLDDVLKREPRAADSLVMGRPFDNLEALKDAESVGEGALDLLLYYAWAQGFVKTVDGRELDVQLQAALGIASQGEGVDYFKLPDSDDFDAIPQDPRNPLTAEKVKLGQLLFHETALLVSPAREEGMHTASCASCHAAQAGFQAGRPQGLGEGGLGFGSRGEGRLLDPHYNASEVDAQPIRSPSAMHVAFQDATLWNGQFSGSASGPNADFREQWTPGTPKEVNHLGYQGAETQAIAGLEVHRLAPIEDTVAAKSEFYRELFDAAFPEGTPNSTLPESGPVGLREAAGLAIAAYERTLLANEAPFQKWIRRDTNAMSEQEKRGAVLFFGKAQCTSCHTGPALNDEMFHALGMADLVECEEEIVADVDDINRGRGEFTGRSEDDFKFKTPQLYNLVDSPFLGHGATFRSVREVVEYKNRAVPTYDIGPNLSPAFKPLGLSETEIDDLTAFIEKSLHDPNLERYVPEAVPSGYCFPVNDPMSKLEGAPGCEPIPGGELDLNR